MKRKEDMRKEWKCNEDTFVLGFIGRIDPIKNFDAMCRAIKGLGNNSKLVIYGAKNPCILTANKILKKLTKELKEQFVYNEPTNDVGSIFYSIDALILPSFSEAMSLTLLEAWGAGTPVVATRVGIIPEFEEKYGKLVESIDEYANENELRTALNNSVKGIKIISRAKDIAINVFDISITIKKWEQYIKKVYYSRY
jgi:glycosyltransferase involved in cell wall biosynthesis